MSMRLLTHKLSQILRLDRSRSHSSQARESERRHTSLHGKTSYKGQELVISAQDTVRIYDLKNICIPLLQAGPSGPGRIVVYRTLVVVCKWGRTGTVWIITGTTVKRTTNQYYCTNSIFTLIVCRMSTMCCR